MRWCNSVSVVLVVGIFACSAALAEGLKEDTVTRFLDSMKALKQDTDYQHAMAAIWEGKHRQTGYPGTLLPSDLVNRDIPAPAYQELSQLSRAYEFSDVDHWLEAGDRVTLAVLSHETQGIQAAFLAEMESIVTDIEADQRLSEAQKNRIRAMVEDGRRQLLRVSGVSESDRLAVRPRLAELKQVLGYQ